MEQTLADNGIPARVFQEIMISCKQEFNGKATKVLGIQGVNNKADEHVYTKGSAPQNENEIAIQPATAKDLGADIGDTITVTIGGKKYDLIISGMYDAMMNMGHSIRFHEDLDIDYNFISGSFSAQILFTDHPSDKEVEKRIEKIKDIFPDIYDVKTGAKQAQDITEVGPVFDTIKFFFLILSAAIVIMVAVLMERSMVIKETSEIATLKAIGFKDNKIIKWHTKRFIITAIISAVISGFLALPISKLIGNPIFSFMGVNSGITYSMNTLRVAVIYPVAIMALMAISVWLTAAYTKRITAQQTSSIE
jgi:putative ABC transport system permease protein